MNKLKKVMNSPLIRWFFPRHRFSSTHMGYHQKLESSCSCTYHTIVANRYGWISPGRCIRLFHPVVLARHSCRFGISTRLEHSHPVIWHQPNR